MTLQQLTYFLAAVRHRSFSAAANELLMAQPSLSEQVRRLEAELGVPLFIRAGRGLELTDAGRLLVPHAEATLAEAERAREAVREVTDMRGGTVAFGTFSGAHHTLTGGLIQEFAVKHPGVKIRVIGQNSAEVADAVRDGALEAGLVVLPIDDVGLETRVMAHEAQLYLSPDPERAKAPVTIQEIARAPLILADARWRQVDPIRRLLRERAQEAGVTVEPYIEVEYMTAALDLAARGLGDTIGSSTILRARGYARRLHAAELDPPMFATYAFIMRRNAHLSPATREFMRLAERRLQALV